MTFTTNKFKSIMLKSEEFENIVLCLTLETLDFFILGVASFERHM